MLVSQEVTFYLAGRMGGNNTIPIGDRGTLTLPRTEVTAPHAETAPSV
jgi:hypothetical protein